MNGGGKKRPQKAAKPASENASSYHISNTCFCMHRCHPTATTSPEKQRRRNEKRATKRVLLEEWLSSGLSSNQQSKAVETLISGHSASEREITFQADEEKRHTHTPSALPSHLPVAWRAAPPQICCCLSLRLHSLKSALYLEFACGHHHLHVSPKCLNEPL